MARKIVSAYEDDILYVNQQIDRTLAKDDPEELRGVDGHLSCC